MTSQSNEDGVDNLMTILLKNVRLGEGLKIVQYKECFFQNYHFFAFYFL